jgi:hypothetical protein
MLLDVVKYSQAGGHRPATSLDLSRRGPSNAMRPRAFAITWSQLPFATVGKNSTVKLNGPRSVDGAGDGFEPATSSLGN